MGLVIRPATTDADLESWRRVRLAVLPDERAQTVAEASPDGGGAGVWRRR